MEKEEFQTSYSKAWDEYLESDDYVKSWKVLSAKGIKQPYLDNILRGAFDAGWNARFGY
jgi:hypothetical protein